MTEKHIPDTLNSIEIRNKFNSQYKFLKITKFWFMLQQINGGFCVKMRSFMIASL